MKDISLTMFHRDCRSFHLVKWFYLYSLMSVVWSVVGIQPNKSRVENQEFVESDCNLCMFEIEFKLGTLVIEKDNFSQEPPLYYGK